MEQTYAQLQCQVLGAELRLAAGMPDTEATVCLEKIAEKVRDALIMLGKRKRKILSQEQKDRMAAARAKGKKGRK